jgi:hypothetical protein
MRRYVELLYILLCDTCQKVTEHCDYCNKCVDHEICTCEDDWDTK